MEKNEIKVKMLGGFELTYGKRSFSIERNKSTKVNQLLQILLYHKGGIERTRLMEFIFDGEDITNPANSLRALVFRLRKILPEHGMPDDEFVSISHGMYSWTKSFPIDSDVHAFEDLIEKLENVENPTEMLDVCEKAFELYDGPFLPMVSETRWASQIDARLKEGYFKCVKILCTYYLKNNEFEKLLNVSQKASKLYPYNEWQLYQMTALIELKRDKEAIKLYEATETMMFEELGVSVSKEMTQMLNRLGEQVVNKSELISNVKSNLDNSKKEEAGAFYCSYPNFLESYRYMKRVISRSGQSAWLMLVTITDGRGVALNDGNRLNKLSSELATAICHTCRGGDMFTKYSENQYLVLLLGLDKDGCMTVQNRINGNMDKDSRKRYLQYHFTKVNSSEGENEIVDFDDIEKMMNEFN